MRKSSNTGITALCMRLSCRSVAGFLLAVGAVAFLLTGPGSPAQDSKTEGVLPAPAEGKAIVCIYRTYRLTGSAAHDEIFVNDTHLGRLLNSEYMFTEVSPGTVVIAGLPKMYYAGGVAMSSYTAISNATKRENERARFEAEAGKTYYYKWTAGAMATGIKVTPEDAEHGARDIRKLHLSKPPDDKEEAKPEAAKPETKQSENPAPQ